MNRATLLATAAAVAFTLAACDRRTEAPPSAPSAAGTPTPAAAAGATPYEQAAQARGFSVGPMMSAHVAYVFFDPACPHCAHLWSAAQPLSNRLRMVWIPVGFLRPASPAQGAVILSAADPAAAMARNEASVLERGPGIPTDPAPPAEVVEQVKANTALFQKLGAESVPFIVFKHAKTGQTGTREGAMSTEELAALLGV